MGPPMPWEYKIENETLRPPYVCTDQLKLGHVVLSLRPRRCRCISNAAAGPAALPVAYPLVYLLTYGCA